MRSRSTSRGRQHSDRGQTTIDFAIGAGVFLIIIAFAFAFVPSMFAPFLDTDRTQAADRVASTLATDSLGSPDEPYLLNRTCTVGFFDQFENGATVTSTCRFDTSSTSVNDALGVGDLVQVNVSIQTREGSVVSLRNAGGDLVRLATGQRVPGNTAVTTARRSVRLAGRTYRLVVHTW